MVFLRAGLAGLLAGLAALAALSAERFLPAGAFAFTDTLQSGRVLYREGEVTVLSAPAPDWTDRLEAPHPDDVTTRMQNGVRLVALDEFASAMGDPPVFFQRQIVDVVSNVGVQTASLFSIPLNPAYETLVLHSVRTGPAGKARERVDDVILSVIQDEDLATLPGLTGRVNVLMRIPGVRPGDRVEVAYSTTGQPDLVDHGNSLFFTAPIADLERLRVRARAPQGAEVAVVDHRDGLAVIPVRRIADEPGPAEGLCADDHGSGAPFCAKSKR